MNQQCVVDFLPVPCFMYVLRYTLRTLIPHSYRFFGQLHLLMLAELTVNWPVAQPSIHHPTRLHEAMEVIC